MTIKLIPGFWRNQEIPEKFLKRYKQVTRFSLEILFIANLNGTFNFILFYFLGFVKTNHGKMNIINLCQV